MKLTREVGDSPRGGAVRGARIQSFATFGASCLPMVAMLPATLVAVLSSIGVRSGASWVDTLSKPLAPVAQPLLIASAMVLAVSSVRCGWPPVVSALFGGSLLYLSMYVVTGPEGRTLSLLFYPGLVAFLGTPLLAGWRVRRSACSPLARVARARRLLLASIALGVVLVASGPALGWGGARSPSPGSRTTDHMNMKMER
jgi:hypothetical protein